MKDLSEKPETLHCPECLMEGRKLVMGSNGKTVNAAGDVICVFVCGRCLAQRRFLDSNDKRFKPDKTSENILM